MAAGRIVRCPAERSSCSDSGGRNPISRIPGYYPEHRQSPRASRDQARAKLHGDIMQMSCLAGGHTITLETPLVKDTITSVDTLPRCPECGATCRPNVVWFGEWLPQAPLSAGRDFAAACDLLLIVGTSGVVSGGYGFTELAEKAGALIVEVNPEPSELSHLAHVCVRLPAGEAVPRNHITFMI